MEVLRLSALIYLKILWLDKAPDKSVASTFYLDVRLVTIYAAAVIMRIVKLY